MDSDEVQSSIDKKEQNMATSNVSYFFGARAFGGLFFTLFGGFGIQYLNKSSLFLIFSAFPLGLMFYTIFVFEEGNLDEYNEETTAEEIREIVQGHLKNNMKENTLEIKYDDEVAPPVSFKTKPTQSKFKRKLKFDNDVSVVSDSFSQIHRKQNPSFFYDLKKILRILKHPKIRKVILLVSIVMITPSFGSTWNYYLTNVIKLQPEDMGELNFMASLGYLIGIIAMNTIFIEITLKNFYRGTTLISSILLSSGLFLLFGTYKTYGINPKIFCAMNAIVSNFVNEINILPILALCCRFCPPGLEAMSYAVFMSITWCTFIISQLFGVGILSYFHVSQDDFSNFWKCIILQTLYGICAAILVSIISFPENFKEVNEFIKSNNLIR